MGSRRDLGSKGEDLACGYLIEKGHQVLERNWRYGHYEIDIISFNENGIHFVEVKTRNAPIMMDPLECVNSSKQKKIAIAAKAYLRRSNFLKLAQTGVNCETNFDIIGISLWKDGSINIDYIEQAFIPIHN